MCEVKSGVVLPDKIVVPLDIDSHTEILESLGIRDSSPFPNFVRVECRPIDDDIFNHDLNNWYLSVDQDFIPEWFDKDKAERQFKEIYLPEFFEKRFIINREVDEIAANSGRWFVKNGIIQKHAGNIEVLCGGGTVNKVCGGTVNKVWSGGTVNKVCGGTVNKVCGGTVINHSSLSKIKNISGGGVVVDRSGGKTKIFAVKNDFEVVEVDPKE